MAVAVGSVIQGPEQLHHPDQHADADQAGQRDHHPQAEHRHGSSIAARWPPIGPTGGDRAMRFGFPVVFPPGGGKWLQFY